MKAKKTNKIRFPLLLKNVSLLVICSLNFVERCGPLSKVKRGKGTSNKFLTAHLRPAGVPVQSGKCCILPAESVHFIAQSPEMAPECQHWRI